jgi:hypothetical protein
MALSPVIEGVERHLADHLTEQGVLRLPIYKLNLPKLARRAMSANRAQDPCLA